MGLLARLVTSAAAATAAKHHHTTRDASAAAAPASSLAQEHELLAIVLETLTAAHAQHGGLRKERWLKTRAWEGVSHIGNRFEQSDYYYDKTRELRPKTICEIGFNGGHSAAVFLSAAGRDATLHVFDLMEFSYSERALALLQAMFPGQIVMHRGDSHVLVPEFQRKEGRPCDLFSVDGDHKYEGAKLDIENAMEATAVGGHLILDDMKRGSKTRRAFDDARQKRLAAVDCTEDVLFNVSYVDRYDQSNVREMTMSWCVGRVAF